MDNHVDLFSPVILGDLELTNRVAMAPLTRMRSGPLGVPGQLVVDHYAQRAGIGLIVTEGTYPVHESQAFVGHGSITTRDEAVALIDSAHADVVAVGRAAIANPDLVERWAGEHPENEPRAHLFYADGAQGYTDYPALRAG